MSKTVQIGSRVFEIPDQGDNPSWGEEVTAWIVAATDALGTVQGANDILTTSATLANNQSTPADIPGLLFNTAEVEAVEIDYVIIRVYDFGATTVVESGKIQGNYDGSEFFISVEAVGESGTTISVLNTGQLQYITTDLADHQATTIRFKAQTIDKP
jgi:hypothetical protein